MRKGVLDAGTALEKAVLRSTERRRSRTYPAVGYTTSPVLKTRPALDQKMAMCRESFCAWPVHAMVMGLCPFRELFAASAGAASAVVVLFFARERATRDRALASLAMALPGVGPPVQIPLYTVVSGPGSGLVATTSLAPAPSWTIWV